MADLFVWLSRQKSSAGRKSGSRRRVVAVPQKPVPPRSSMSSVLYRIFRSSSRLKFLT
ncbi:hypothetical protein RHECNPAF_750090 [Rhizobium etli CNPAF512]|nr:hypothetical protein RHECNPAF_750090 [Rhizobium etli CNPAF512]